MSIVFDESEVLKQVAIRTLDVAVSETGNGESTGNNRGPDIERYTRGMRRALWCAHFVSWCLEIACRDIGVTMPFKRSGHAKTLARRYRSVGYMVAVPSPGDIICWHRGAAPKVTDRGHIGIVRGYSQADDTLRVIEGNHGTFPAIVDTFQYPRGLWRNRLYILARLYHGGLLCLE